MSNKSKSKKQSIIELISCGFTDSEIADTLHISAQSGYIRKLRRSLAESSPEESTQEQDKPKLTPERYYNAVMKHNGTKDVLAAILGVCRKTLYTFEHSAQMKNRLARYMRVRGMSLEVIAGQIGTKVSTLEKMGLDKLPTLDGIKIQMEIALEPLADIAQWDNEAASLFYRLQDALKRLK